MYEKGPANAPEVSDADFFEKLGTPFSLFTAAHILSNTGLINNPWNGKLSINEFGFFTGGYAYERTETQRTS